MMERRNCPKHIEFYSRNKFEKLVHLFGFIVRLYHEAWSPERQIFIQILQGKNFVIYPCTHCVYCLCNISLYKKLNDAGCRARQTSGTDCKTCSVHQKIYHCCWQRRPMSTEEFSASESTWGLQKTIWLACVSYHLNRHVQLYPEISIALLGQSTGFRVQLSKMTLPTNVTSQSSGQEIFISSSTRRYSLLGAGIAQSV